MGKVKEGKMNSCLLIGFDLLGNFTLNRKDDGTFLGVGIECNGLGKDAHFGGIVGGLYKTFGTGLNGIF